MFVAMQTWARYTRAHQAKHSKRWLRAFVVTISTIFPPRSCSRLSALSYQTPHSAVGISARRRSVRPAVPQPRPRPFFAYLCEGAQVRDESVTPKATIAGIVSSCSMIRSLCCISLSI